MQELHIIKFILLLKSKNLKYKKKLKKIKKENVILITHFLILKKIISSIIKNINQI